MPKNKLLDNLNLTPYSTLTSGAAIKNDINVIEMNDYGTSVKKIKRLIVSAAASFCEIGYYLKHIRENELYKEHGYTSVYEAAYAEFKMERSTAYRHMQMNDLFSEGGNSPFLAEPYKDFSKGQLQEMMYLPDNQIDEVTPDMTVMDIRKLKSGQGEENEEDEPNPDDDGVATSQHKEQLPGQVKVNEYFDDKDDFAGFGDGANENNYQDYEDYEDDNPENDFDEVDYRDDFFDTTDDDNEDAEYDGMALSLLPEEVQGLKDYIEQHRPQFDAMGDEWMNDSPRTYYKKCMALKACEFMLLCHEKGNLS